MQIYVVAVVTVATGVPTIVPDRAVLAGYMQPAFAYEYVAPLHEYCSAVAVTGGTVQAGVLAMVARRAGRPEGVVDTEQNTGFFVRFTPVGCMKGAPPTILSTL